MSNELTEAEREALAYGWREGVSRPLGLIPTVERILAARETALRAQIAKEIRAEREGFLASPGLDPAWIAGWHSATDHIAARIAEGGTDE